MFLGKPKGHGSYARTCRAHNTSPVGDVTSILSVVLLPTISIAHMVCLMKTTIITVISLLYEDMYTHRTQTNTLAHMSHGQISLYEAC